MNTRSGHESVLTGGFTWGAACVGFAVCAPAIAADASSRTRVGSALRGVIIGRVSSIDPNGGPRLGDGSLRRAAGAIQVASRLNRRRPRGVERRVRGEQLRERTIEHLLDLLAIGAADALHGESRGAVRAAFNREVERLVGDGRIRVDAAVVVGALETLCVVIRI